MSSGDIPPPHHHLHQQQQQQQHYQRMGGGGADPQHPQQHSRAPGAEIIISHHHSAHPRHHVVVQNQQHQQHLASLSHSPQDRDPGHGLSAEDIQELLGGVLDDPNGGGGIHSSSSGAYGGVGDGGDDSADDAPGAAGGVDANGIPLEAKAVARSERKRSREKQRRSDVNKQFADLTEVLRRIEAELHNASTSDDGDDSKLTAPRLLTSFSPTNRVDLIARTIQVLTSLETVTKKQRAEIKRLGEDLENAKLAGEETAAKLKEQMTAPVNMGSNRVMMMVPMMIGGDQPPQPMMHPMMHPFMSPGFMNNMGGNGTTMQAMPGVGGGGGGTDPSSTSSVAGASGLAPWMNPQATWQMMQAMPGGMAPMMPGNSQQQQQQNNNNNSSSDSGKPSSRATTSGNLAHCA
jgi:hypothetical protein